MPAVRSRTALLCVASAITASLTFGGTALAAADPAPGTQACTDAVNLNATVRTDRGNVNDRLDELNTARATGNASQIAAAQRALDAANAKLRLDIADVTDRVCTGDAAPDPTTPPVDNNRDFRQIRALIAALDCDGFRGDLDRINDARRDATLTSEQVRQVENELNARLRALGFCNAEPADPQPTTVTVEPPATSTQTRPNVVGGADVDNNVTVNPTQDDGSTANTDGSQIDVVPSGSASTGAA